MQGRKTKCHAPDATGCSLDASADSLGEAERPLCMPGGMHSADAQPIDHRAASSTSIATSTNPVSVGGSCRCCSCCLPSVFLVSGFALRWSMSLCVGSAAVTGFSSPGRLAPPLAFREPFLLD